MSAITYGWANSAQQDSFWIRFAACSREPKNWKEELYAAARTIAARTQKPIWICSSGGIDSEVACRAFFDQGIPFSVLTLEHTAGTNQHDIRYAREWLESHNVPHKFAQIDMQSFLAKEIFMYAERYPAIHPFRYLQIRLMELVEEMEGFAVLCSGEQLYWNDPKRGGLARSDMFLPLSNGTAMPLEWCKDHNADHEPYFHFATPELCLAYLRLPVIKMALDNPGAIFTHPSNTYLLKKMAYMAQWPDMEPRLKFDGYEAIQTTSFKQAKERLSELCGQKFMLRRISVPEFELQLTGA